VWLPHRKQIKKKLWSLISNQLNSQIIQYRRTKMRKKIFNFKKEGPKRETLVNLGKPLRLLTRVMKTI
jgi:hypothetical protein